MFSRWGQIYDEEYSANSNETGLKSQFPTPRRIENVDTIPLRATYTWINMPAFFTLRFC